MVLRGSHKETTYLEELVPNSGKHQFEFLHLFFSLQINTFASVCPFVSLGPGSVFIVSPCFSHKGNLNFMTTTERWPLVPCPGKWERYLRTTCGVSVRVLWQREGGRAGPGGQKDSGQLRALQVFRGG